MANADAIRMTAAVVSLFVAVVLVGMVRAYALRFELLDVPSARSSHQHPTPRGGGLGLLLSWGAGLITAGFPLADSVIYPALGGIVAVAAVGWRDDHGGLSIRVRLLVHLLAGLTLVPLALTLGPAAVVTGWLGAIWWVFWSVSAINLLNFMDGLDGLIGLQGAIFGLHCWLLGENGTLSTSAGAALLGAAAGFLCWNWVPAKIFLGDVGSGTLGLIVVLLGMLLIQEGRADLIQAYLPLLPVFLDATVTLLRRWRSGEQLTQAHRSHLYQRLSRVGWGHGRVSLLYGVFAFLGVGAAQVQGSAMLSARVLYGAGVLAAGALLDRRAGKV